MAVELLQTLINALRPSALYALIGLGFVVVYLATGSINFAQGEFVVFGGLGCAFLAALGISLPVAIIVTLLGSLVLGCLFDLLLIRPLGSGSMLRMVMISIGASTLLRQFALHIFGPDEHTMSTFFKQQVAVFGPLRIEIQTLILLGTFLGALGIFLLLYYRTRFGKGVRANQQSPEGAMLVGVRPARIVNRSFMLAAFLGALCGVLITPLTQMTFDAGTGLGVKGFTAAILGGLSNPLGVVLGGLLLGMSETVTAAYINPIFKDVIALVLLIAALIIRPSGILARVGQKKL
jgi:branched-chain amino acid transport system permease protein